VTSTSELDERVLVLLPTRSDADRTVQILAEDGFRARACDDDLALCRELRAGAGVVILSDEFFGDGPGNRIEAALREQPAWSTLPVLVFARESAVPLVQRGALGGYPSIAIVERPVRKRALLGALEAALRGRRNQYQVRDSLREQERQARQLSIQGDALSFALSAGGLGSWEINLKNGVLVASDLCKANYGWPLDQPFSNQQRLDSIHPDDRARVAEAVQRSIEDKTQLDVEHRVIWPNGEVHWLLARGRASYDASGAPISVAGVSLDVTQRERMHQALKESQAALAQQAEQLRAADRHKDEFLATLAHELRNPLAPVSTGLTILQSSTDPAKVQRTVEVMRRQVDHMVRLIDDLLDVSRITWGKLELKRERISVRSVIDAAVEASAPSVQRGQHALSVDVPLEPLYLDADHTRVAQIVSNLLTNASKYTPARGQLRLTVRQDGKDVVIQVQDNGMGIPTDRLEDIFRMFGQVNQSLDRSQGGLGVGLALVRRLVEMHGGSVSAHSEGAGKGSLFTVRLPLAEGPRAASKPVSTYPAGTRDGKRVLIVDDNADAGEMLGLLLDSDGYQTQIVKDGPAAIRAATERAPSVIILDIGLPGMSGYEVAQRLRQEQALSQTAIIALSGWGSPEDKRRSAEAGFDLHLTKPVVIEELRVALGRAAKRRASGLNPPAEQRRV